MGWEQYALLIAAVAGVVSAIVGTVRMILAYPTWKEARRSRKLQEKKWKMKKEE
jgi:hypothetical protein